MSGKRTKLLRKQALSLGIDIKSLQIAGKGIANRFKKIKKYYLNYACFPK